MPGDPPILPILIFGGAALAMVTLFVLGAIYAKRRAEERRAALMALADSLGCRFRPHTDHAHDERYRQFGVFNQGHGRAAYNTIAGEVTLGGQSCDLIMGDYRYKETSGSGKNRRTTTYRLSYLLCHLPYPDAPALRIRREHVLDKIASVMGFDDIDFESAEFSRRFHVSSSDKRFAYDIVHPGMMEFLLAEAGDRSIEQERGVLLLLGPGRSIWEPSGFVHAVELIDRYLSLWPEHVTRDLRQRSRMT
ncbi:MAG: hypothetical protein ACTS22_02540 [Phycisphaerales bacterium]